MELDSCCSSDALLMNVFCHPDIRTSEKFAALFGFRRIPTMQFGFKANLPFKNGGNEPTSSEIDLRLYDLTTGRVMLIEAKLAENDFTSRDKAYVLRYRDFASVFADRLSSEKSKYRHYQLIRNILSADHYDACFCLICDRRRPDLHEAWREIIQAVMPLDLKLRCSLITWQEIAMTMPPDVQTFLEEKYGIVPDDGRKGTPVERQAEAIAWTNFVSNRNRG
jgi:hypothetical protein